MHNVNRMANRLLAHVYQILLGPHQTVDQNAFHLPTAPATLLALMSVAVILVLEHVVYLPVVMC